MEGLETRRQKTEDEALVAKLVATYAEELEKMVTNPGSPFSKEEMALVANFRDSRKLPRNNKWFHDLFVRVAQDFRFNADEIDILRDRFLD